MNSKMTSNSQLTTEPKIKIKTKQTTKTETESQKWKLHGGLSEGRGSGDNGKKDTGNKKHKW